MTACVHSLQSSCLASAQHVKSEKLPARSKRINRPLNRKSLNSGQNVLLENLGAGMSIEEVIEQFPVNRKEIDGLMAFVARSLYKAPTYG